MSKSILSDELWAAIEPLLPPEKPRPRGGRKPIPARRALLGILFVLKTGAPWEHAPREVCGCSGMTCWRRLRDWQAAGVWDKLHRALLDRLGVRNGIDFERACLDSQSYAAKRGGEATGPNPTDRGRAGSKRHVIIDANGIPLAVRVTPANVHDSRMLEAMSGAVPPIRQCVGRPRKRPQKLHADKGYDYDRCRKALQKRRIKARIARKGVGTSQRLGRRRWVVERTIAWFSRFRRLTVRYERRADIHTAFTTIAAAIITGNFCQK